MLSTGYIDAAYQGQATLINLAVARHLAAVLPDGVDLTDEQIEAVARAVGDIAYTATHAAENRLVNTAADEFVVDLFTSALVDGFPMPSLLSDYRQAFEPGAGRSIGISSRSAGHHVNGRSSAWTPPAFVPYTPTAAVSPQRVSVGLMCAPSPNAMTSPVDEIRHPLSQSPT